MSTRKLWCVFKKTSNCDLSSHCSRPLFYPQDFFIEFITCISTLQYEIVTVSADGVEVVGPLVGKNDWTIASYVR